MRLSHVTWGKLLNISVLQFPHLENCDKIVPRDRMDSGRGVFLGRQLSLSAPSTE